MLEGKKSAGKLEWGSNIPPIKCLQFNKFYTINVVWKTWQVGMI